MDNSSPVTATYIRTVYKPKFKSLFLIARGLFKPTSSSSGSTLPSGFPRCHRYWHRGLFKAPKPDKEIGRRPAPVCIIRPGRADPRRRHAQHTPRGRAGRVPSSRQPGRRLSMDLCHLKKKKLSFFFVIFFFLSLKRFCTFGAGGHRIHARTAAAAREAPAPDKAIFSGVQSHQLYCLHCDRSTLLTMSRSLPNVVPQIGVICHRRRDTSFTLCKSFNYTGRINFFFVCVNVSSWSVAICCS